MDSMLRICTSEIFSGADEKESEIKALFWRYASKEDGTLSEKSFCACTGLMKYPKFSSALFASAMKREDGVDTVGMTEDLFLKLTACPVPIKIFFDMCDADGDGLLSLSDLKEALQLSGVTNKLGTKEEINDALGNIIQCYSYNGTHIKLAGFESLLNNTPAFITDYVKPYGKLSPTEMTWRRLEHYGQKHWQAILCLIIWVAAMGNLFIMKVNLVRTHSVYRMLGPCVCTAKGAAETIKLNCALILLPMARGLMTWLRSTRYTRQILPFQYSKRFHMWLGWAILIAGLLHTVMHLACDFPQLTHMARSRQTQHEVWVFFHDKKPTYAELVKTPVGITGIFILACFALAYPSATTWARRHSNKPKASIGKASVKDELQASSRGGVRPPAKHMQRKGSLHQHPNDQAGMSAEEGSRIGPNSLEEGSRIGPNSLEEGRIQNVKADAPREGRGVLKNAVRQFLLYLRNLQSGLCLTVLYLLAPCKWILNFRGYSQFRITHYLLFPVFYALLIVHGQSLLLDKAFNDKNVWMYVALPMGIFVSDLLWRNLRAQLWGRTVAERAIVEDDSGGRVLKLQIRKPEGFRYCSGMFLYLQCPSISYFEWHPFSISSAPEDSSITVHIKEAGDWTFKLAEKFQKIGGHVPLVNDLETSESKDTVKDPVPYPTVLIEGPYAAPTQDHHRFEIALLVGLGIGITPIISVLRNLLNESRRIDASIGGDINGKLNKDTRPNKLKHVYFFCVTRISSTFKWFEEAVRDLNLSDQEAKLNIQFHLTSIPGNGNIQSALFSAVQAHQYQRTGRDLISRTPVAVHFGRPVWSSILENITAKHPNTKVGTFYCGPKGAGKELRRQCMYRTVASNFSNEFVYHQESF